MGRWNRFEGNGGEDIIGWYVGALRLRGLGVASLVKLRDLSSCWRTWDVISRGRMRRLTSLLSYTRWSSKLHLNLKLFGFLSRNSLDCRVVVTFSVISLCMSLASLHACARAWHNWGVLFVRATGICQVLMMSDRLDLTLRYLLDLLRAITRHIVTCCHITVLVCWVMRAREVWSLLFCLCLGRGLGCERMSDLVLEAVDHFWALGTFIVRTLS